MKKNILWVRKSLLPTLLALVFSMVIVSVGTASPIPIITQTNSTATVYLDPPTINATAIGQEFTVNLNIRDAPAHSGWQAGLTFNASILNCTGFYEGEFLSDEGATFWVGDPGYINNTLGDIIAHGCSLLFEDVSAEGDGRLAYLNFTAKAPGISDLHLRDVMLTHWVWVETPPPGDWEKVVIPSNIIDVYTVAPHSVVTLSSSTGAEAGYRSGFSDHAYNALLKKISFNVVSPFQAWSNVTIPIAFLSTPVLPYVWGVIIDGFPVSISLTPNTTHTSIYFTYAAGIHAVEITTRFRSSTISIALSPESLTVGSMVTISGDIDPVRQGVNVTILYRPTDGTWTALGNTTTDSNGDYSYPWTPDETGTYEVKARWAGDSETLGDESDVKILKVKEAGIDPYILIAVVVVIIIVAAVVVYYFVRVRKARLE